MKIRKHITRCPFQLKAKSKKSYSHFLSNCFDLQEHMTYMDNNFMKL